VLYLADHGEYLGDHYAYGKRGYHDPACRVPFILSWPDQVPAGQERHQLVGLAYVLPTLIAGADGGPESLSPLNLDGCEVLSLARDAQAPGRAIWTGQLAEQQRGLYAAMDQEWKYIYSAPDDREYLLRRGPGEGRDCDRNECVDHAADPAARPVLERLRAALVDRFRRDGYQSALDEQDPAGWRRYPAPHLPWTEFDELEQKSVVGRGWQYARWNTNPPYDTPEHDRRLDPAKRGYQFPSRNVAPAPPGARSSEPAR
jgi:arylsulfatase A-like enzyme